jgi:uncharacterized membrane protein YfcA
MDPAQLAILTVAAFATSMLSGMLGLAGGMTLLAILLLFYDPLVAIPLHGAIQLVSNGSRTWIQRSHVERQIVLWYSLLLLPMGFVGLAFAKQLSPELARSLIGLFVLAATWAPGLLLLGAHPERLQRNRRFLMLGGVVGLLNTTVGATGPLVAPFFLNLGLGRQQVVGTMAASQTLGHLAKLVVFGAAGFAFAGFAGPLVLLSIAVVVGTWAGSRALDRVSERSFVGIYKAALTAIALYLVASELPALFAGA